MDLLIVDDEVGIREGLASFLRLQGHRVRTAASAGAGIELLGTEVFDAVVTDWQLPDGDAAPILEHAGCPCIVVSGHVDGAVRHDNARHVLSKPVLPDRLGALLASLEAAPTPSAAPLPVDTAARVELVRSLCGDVEIFDDGRYVTLEAELPSDEILDDLRLLGGDLRVRSAGGARWMVLRLERDGRPAGVESTLPPDASWHDGDGEIAVDLDRGPCTPRQFVALLDRVAATRRTVHLLNVPPHLRLFVEALGRSAELPKRDVAGPRLPEVLSELWS